MRNWASGALAFLLGFTLMLGLNRCAQAATTILPPGETCFSKATGPLSSGSIYMLIPNTVSPKNTWQDDQQSVLNTNPIQLDSNGCALIYGTGQYRQQVYDGPVVGGLPTGNLLYDVVTTDTSSYQNVFWAGTSAGTPNAIAVTDAGFNSTDGSVINFVALNSNTGAATLNVSGGGAVPIRKPSGSGPVALTSGCIVATNPVSVVYSSSAAAFLLLTECSPNAAAATAVPPPGGYLTLSSDASSPIITSDANAGTAVFYTPYVSNQVPIWNGSSFTLYSTAQLTLTLNAGAHIANTIYDICIFLNNSVPTLATGPAWSNSAAGSGARGTGAGTTQLQRVNGLWVNAVAITGINGGNTYSIAANQCTYLGSIFIDSIAGQISATISFGQNRKWGVWNAYNRQQIEMQIGDSTGAWSYNTATVRASNGTPGNAATVLTGLAEEPVAARFVQFLTMQTSTPGPSIGIGLNSTTAFSGTAGQIGCGGTQACENGASAAYTAVPFLGIGTFNQLEKGAGTGTNTFDGTQLNMSMSVRYRG